MLEAARSNALRPITVDAIPILEELLNIKPQSGGQSLEVAFQSLRNRADPLYLAMTTANNIIPVSIALGTISEPGPASVLGISLAENLRKDRALFPDTYDLD